jgi:hypothetical protein
MEEFVKWYNTKRTAHVIVVELGCIENTNPSIQWKGKLHETDLTGYLEQVAMQNSSR